MRTPKIRTVAMVRRIRDKHTRLLAGKTTAEKIAFYRAAGEAAMRATRERAKPRSRKAG